MTNISRRTSTTRSHCVLRSRRRHCRVLSTGTQKKHLLVQLIVGCAVALLLPTVYAAKGYLDATSGRGGGGVDDAGTALAAAATSSSASEIVQLPHTFRHQEHYSHRIEQAVNDFKTAQLQQQQQQQQQLKERDKNLTAASNNKIMRHQQIQAAQQQQQQHHRRHEQHLEHRQQQLQQEQLQQQQMQQQQMQLQQQQLQQHQLRHHNRHHAAWVQRVFPELHHQRHQQHRNMHAATSKTTSPTTTADVAGNELGGDNKLHANSFNTNGSSSSSSNARYFDRDSQFSNRAAWRIPTTSGPKIRHNSHKQQNDDRASDGGDNGDDDYWNIDESTESGGLIFDDAVDEKRSSDGGQRISLKLHANTAEDDDEYRNDYESDENKKANMAGDDNVSKSNDNEDDYDYEESDEAAEEEGQETHSNEFPRSHGGGISNSAAKASVKRFTNPFDLYYKVGSKRGDNYAGSSGSENENNKNNNHNNDNDNDNDDDNEDDEIFSSEKWNKIEHEHHLKQQQHQRELQALRAKHGGLGTGLYDNKKFTAVAAEKSPQINDDEMTNIFSRYYIPGTLTRQKQTELGTPEAVQESRRTHAVKQKQHKAMANAHVKQIISEATCRVPQRRIERIQRESSKVYTPHCTVLHRCADDTGCCRSERQTCAPKRTKSVDLYFFVKSINDKKGAIERLTFVNHTECHCVDKSKHRPDEYSYGAFYSGGGGGAQGQQVLRRATILNCNCPRLYEKILQEDGFCRCDCSSGNTGCDWLKRGMEHFSMIDRKCILEGRCKPPTCQYGNFIKKHGRCPRREEQLSATLGASSASSFSSSSAASSPSDRVLLTTNALSSYH